MAKNINEVSFVARDMETITVRNRVILDREEMERIIEKDVQEPIGHELYNRILKKTQALDCNYDLVYPAFGISVKLRGNQDCREIWQTVFVLIDEFLKED